MQFLSQNMLLLLALIPAFAVGYIVVQRRRTRFALRYPSLGLVRQAVPPRNTLRRHLPFALLLVAVGTMFLALARPAAAVMVPKQEGTMVLAMDISASMSETDLKPSRIEAAKAAARALVSQKGQDLRVGIVAFSGTASILQMPTDDQFALFRAINGLATDRSTAIGSGLLTSLDAIFGKTQFGSLDQLDASTPLPPGSPAAPAPGTRSSAVIILLTDGENIMGPDPIQAAQLAARYGIKVLTIGIGTPPGKDSSVFPGDELDEATLKQIAQITGGQYYHASDEVALADIYRSIDKPIILEPQQTEVTNVFTAAAFVLALGSMVLSFLWFGHLP